MGYDPRVHKRRSIRLKGYDYAGGGVYFVTICAHRDLVRSTGGSPFKDPTMREIIDREWRRAEEFRLYVHLGEYVIMPDHFHALITIDGGHAPLGEVIGAFKAAVSRRRRGEMHLAQTDRGHCEGEIHLARTCVGFGNPVLLQMHRVGVLASGNGPVVLPDLPQDCVLVSGLHSGLECSLLKNSGLPCIKVAAVGPEHVGLLDWELARLARGRMAVVCPFDAERVSRATALLRNRLIAQWVDRLCIPSVRAGGSLEQLRDECAGKVMA